MHQLLVRGLPPLVSSSGDDDDVASSSSSCVLLDGDWRLSLPREAVAAALMKRQDLSSASAAMSALASTFSQSSSSGASPLSPPLTYDSALALADKCWLEHGGRPLPSDRPLGTSLLPEQQQQQDETHCCASSSSSSSLSPLLPFSVCCRVRALGGGGDGGSTGAESRSSYLEMYASAKPDAVDPALVAATRATACALSGEPLRPPLVADALGSLFNKEAVLAGLVAKGLPPALAHVSSIRHVFDARVTEIKEGGEGGGRDGGEGGDKNGAAHGAAKNATANASADSLAPRFCCPVTGIHLNGKNRFLLLRPSGLVVSERAVRVALPAVEEAAAEAEEEALLLLPQGGGKASTDGGAREVEDGKKTTKLDLSSAIRLLPPLSELAAAREKLLLERAAEAAAKAEKKNKKSKKRKGGGGEGEGEGGATAAAAGEEEQRNGNGVGSGNTRSAEEEAAERKRRIAASTSALAPAGADKEVFASIFLSSKKGEEKESFGCRATGLGRR